MSRTRAINEMAAYLAAPAAGVKVPPVTVQRNSDGQYLVFSMALRAKTLYEYAQAHYQCDCQADDYDYYCSCCTDYAYELIPEELYAFDNEIGNIDRHTGNALIDEEGTIWSIDHESGRWDDSKYRQYWDIASAMVDAL